jgi:hypothetical protein
MKMKSVKISFLLFLILCLTASSFAKGKRDPLTEAEVAQLREATQEPLKRIKLLVDFARARMFAIDQIRGDHKLEGGRGKQIHDLLEDFTYIADELDSNVDMYARQHSDIRKPLKGVVEGYTEWQLKLRALKEADRSKPSSVAEMKEYEFPLESAIETVNAGLDSSRELLDKQNKDIPEEKRKKK